MSDQSRKRIAVFASGNGSNLQALLDACRKGDILGDIVAVVSNKRQSYALARARNAGIEALFFDPSEYNTKTEMCAKIAKALKERKIDLICLAGYMNKIEPCLIRSFPGHILNIHPALLPKFGGQGMYGIHVHEAVLAQGEKESGCTVHVVDEIYDHGPILAQSKVSVDPFDTPHSLAEKIHALEHPLYVSVVRDICSGTLDLNKVLVPARSST